MLSHTHTVRGHRYTDKLKSLQYNYYFVKLSGVFLGWKNYCSKYSDSFLTLHFRVYLKQFYTCIYLLSKIQMFWCHWPFRLSIDISDRFCLILTLLQIVRSVWSNIQRGAAVDSWSCSRFQFFARSLQTIALLMLD